MAISNLVLTRQIYSEETNGAHAHNRDRVPLNRAKIYLWVIIMYIFLVPVTLVSAWAKTASSEKRGFDCFCGSFGDQEIVQERILTTEVFYSEH